MEQIFLNHINIDNDIDVDNFDTIGIYIDIDKAILENIDIYIAEGLVKDHTFLFLHP